MRENRGIRRGEAARRGGAHGDQYKKSHASKYDGGAYAGDSLGRGGSGGSGGSGTPFPGRSRVRRYARWLPAALIVAGIVIDLLTPPSYTPSAVFAAAPLVAAPLLSARGTALVSAVSLLTLLALLLLRGAPGEAESVMRMTTVAVAAALSLGVNYLVRRSDQQLASARGIAEVAQLAVLPAPPARIGALDVAARYEAAQTDARIGGDLYAVQETPFGVRLIVGDVRGKGLGSVEAVAVVLGAFREAAEAEPSLEAVAARLERALQREGSRRLGLDQFEGFTTAVLAEVPGERPERLRLLNRGHPPPLLLAAGTVRSLEPAVPALPLGLAELGEWPDRAEEAPFPAGAQLLLYTDGLSESRDAEGRFYDPAGRLSGRTFTGPEDLLDTLTADVAAHTGGGKADDMALLAVGRLR